MKSARIIATSAASAWQSRLSSRMESEGFSVESSAPSQLPAPDTIAADLLLALDVPLETFSTACSEATGCRLAIHVATAPAADPPPPSLPAYPPARDTDIRRLALTFAPHMRVNAITAVYGTPGSIDAIVGEILAAVMLFVQCPAMTGVVIPIDRPYDTAGATAYVQQSSESRS